MNAIPKPAADFAIRNLAVLSYAQGFTAWHYRARTATLVDVLTPGFFNKAVDMIEAGDTVMVSASDGGALLFIHEGGSKATRVRAEPMCGTAAALARASEQCEGVV